MRFNGKLENIGYYTLSNQRALTASANSTLQRCELILTDRCSFKCPYCRGLPKWSGDISFCSALKVLNYWINDGLKNVRFSGGEPTLYNGLEELVKFCKKHNVGRIAISTNGASSLDKYKRLIDCGVNDFSISLDACCSSVGSKMAGVKGAWEKVIRNIEELSKLTYVSVGMVFTEDNVNDCINHVKFADSLGISDIRVIPSAQYNIALTKLKNLPIEIRKKYPILNYRINNILNGIHVRGIESCDTNRCPLVLDDMAVAKNKHFPCIIYLREGGRPIGNVGPNMREQRYKWFLGHDTHRDKICKNNCLEVCQHYNNFFMERRNELSACV